jgi:hypothetical protein
VVTGSGTGGLSHATFPLTLGGTGGEFIGAPLSTTGANAGNYTLATTGTLLLPSTVTTGAAINGLLTITLTNADF